MRIAVRDINGLVGDAFYRLLYKTQLFPKRDDVDLLDTHKLSLILKSDQIEVATNCAAVVGEIQLNRIRSYVVFYSNIVLSQATLQACISSGVSDLVQSSSNCSYPDPATQPYKESALFDSPSHKLNCGYASAKIASVHAGQCAEDQGLIRVYHPIPCSLFGRNDNCCQNNSHFIAEAIRKIFEAKPLNQASVHFWDTGTTYRESMYADNLVCAVLLLLKKSFQANQLVLAQVLICQLCIY